MSLHELTRDLHHACEAHAIGQAMVTGAITPQQWADWLWSLRCLHSVVDVAMPWGMKRDAALSADLALLPDANPSRAALWFAGDLVGKDTSGAAYVLHGAHRSGGRVMAPKMAKGGLPTNHTVYVHPEGARDWIAALRVRPEYAEQARATFHCLLAVMHEIEERYP